MCYRVGATPLPWGRGVQSWGKSSPGFPFSVGSRVNSLAGSVAGGQSGVFSAGTYIYSHQGPKRGLFSMRVVGELSAALSAQSSVCATWV